MEVSLGKKVRLRSGGPPLTVTGAKDAQTGRAFQLPMFMNGSSWEDAVDILCTWFDSSDNNRHGRFKLGLLDEVDDV